MNITVKWLGTGTENNPFMLDLPKGKQFKAWVGSDKPVLNGEVEIEVRDLVVRSTI